MRARCVRPSAPPRWSHRHRRCRPASGSRRPGMTTCDPYASMGSTVQTAAMSTAAASAEVAAREDPQADRCPLQARRDLSQATGVSRPSPPWLWVESSRRCHVGKPPRDWRRDWRTSRKIPANSPIRIGLKNRFGLWVRRGLDPSPSASLRRRTAYLSAVEATAVAKFDDRRWVG